MNFKKQVDFLTTLLPDDSFESDEWYGCESREEILPYEDEEDVCEKRDGEEDGVGGDLKRVRV